jgi:ABC-type uncharacterized transport system substrate-binding protein
MRRSWVAGLGVVAMLAGATGARAHPHVWIDARNGVEFDAEGRIVALDVEWTFDEFYTAFAVDGLDTDGDGKLEDEELQPLAKLNVTSLKDYRYFTEADLGGAPIDYGEVTQYGSRMDEGRLVLQFRLPLAEPADPRKGAFSVVSYDPTFYIAIEMAENEPVTMAGGGGCNARLEAGKDAADLFTFSENLFQQIDVTRTLSRSTATTVWVECG